MTAARVGPVNAPSVNRSRPGSTCIGKVSGRRPRPLRASKIGSAVSQVPTNAMTKKLSNGCWPIKRLSGEEVAGCDVVTVVMRWFLSCQGDKQALALTNVPSAQLQRPEASLQVEVPR